MDFFVSLRLGPEQRGKLCDSSGLSGLVFSHNLTNAKHKQYKYVYMYKVELVTLNSPCFVVFYLKNAALHI